VRFAGYVPDDELWDCYATSDLFVTPALADFNITPFEALALRCRVLWSNEMEADPALMDSGAVTAVPPTPQDFARAMTALLGAPAAPSWDITPYLLSTRYGSLSSLFDRVIQSQPAALNDNAARR
jgi:glycosyltransferase involved in cell wall biosynthesis